MQVLCTPFHSLFFLYPFFPSIFFFQRVLGEVGRLGLGGLIQPVFSFTVLDQGWRATRFANGLQKAAAKVIPKVAI